MAMSLDSSSATLDIASADGGPPSTAQSVGRSTSAGTEHVSHGQGSLNFGSEKASLCRISGTGLRDFQHGVVACSQSALKAGTLAA